MEITFERATLTDAQALTNAQIRAFHNDAVIYPGAKVDGPPGYDSVDETLKDIAKYPYYKILCDGQIVGGIIIFDRGGGHLHLDRIYIDPDYHNRGIGSQAMQFIEAEHPAPLWTLDTPAYAVRNHHFYEKFGYVKVGEKEESVGGLILICYEKRIR
jgi:GNAT superfamily N-acetyltransferase